MDDGLSLGRLCRVSKACLRGASEQRHWRALCIETWAIDAERLEGGGSPRRQGRPCACEQCAAFASATPSQTCRFAGDAAASDTADASPRLRRCGRCKMVAYCSVDCQRANWAEHRRCCVAPQLEKTEPPECWRRTSIARSLLWFPGLQVSAERVHLPAQGLFGSNHTLLRRTFLDPGLDNTLRQAYPRLSSFSIA